MDAVLELLEFFRAQDVAKGHLLGLLNVLIGRRISGPQGNLISAGMTFRDLATALRRVRWEIEQVREMGIDPDSLPPRDRQRFWFGAICQAQVDSDKARQAGDRFAQVVKKMGYQVGPGPVNS